MKLLLNKLLFIIALFYNCIAYAQGNFNPYGSGQYGSTLQPPPPPSNVYQQQPQQFQQVNPFQAKTQPPPQNYNTPANFQSRQQQSFNEYQKILQELKEDDAKENANNNHPTYNTTHFEKAFTELLNMQKGIEPFSLKKAVFIVENAYVDNTMSYELYNKKIQAKVKLIQQLFVKENIKANNNLGKNFVIQKLFSDTIKDVQGKKHLPYYYDLNDFNGDEDWTQMFVTKLLNKGNGQCHSMPLLYLIIAEQLNTKAWLTYSPEHSLIMFSDNTGKNLYYFETTRGCVVADNWLMAGGYITTSALKNKIYLDTVSQQGLIEECINDLMMGYQIKFGFDDFCDHMLETLLKINPKNLQAQMTVSNVLTYSYVSLAQSYGLTSKLQFPKYPDVNELYNIAMEQYEYMDNLGYAQMPKEQYKEWLSSLKDEQRQREMQLLKTTIKKNAKQNN